MEWICLALRVYHWRGRATCGGISQQLGQVCGRGSLGGTQLSLKSDPYYFCWADLRSQPGTGRGLYPHSPSDSGIPFSLKDSAMML